MREKKISRSCRREEVHSSVEELLGRYEGNRELHNVVANLAEEFAQKRGSIHLSEIETIKKSLRRLEQEKVRYEHKFIDPDFEEVSLKRTLQANRKSCKEQIAKLKVKLFELEGNEKSYEHLPAIRETIKSPLRIWKNEDVETKQLLLKVMFNGVLEYQKNEGLRTPHFGLPLRDLAM